MPGHYIHIAAADRGVALLERLDVWHILGSLVFLPTNALMKLAIQSVDWFGKFSLSLNRGYDSKGFFWSGMLHYRRTSQFGCAPPLRLP